MDKDIFNKKFSERLSEINGFMDKKNKLIQQSMADLNVLIGAKTECEFWIKQINNPEVEIKKDHITVEELKAMTGASEAEIVNINQMK